MNVPAFIEIPRRNETETRSTYRRIEAIPPPIPLLQRWSSEGSREQNKFPPSLPRRSSDVPPPNNDASVGIEMKQIRGIPTTALGPAPSLNLTERQRRASTNTNASRGIIDRTNWHQRAHSFPWKPALTETKTRSWRHSTDQVQCTLSQRQALVDSYNSINHRTAHD